MVYGLHGGIAQGVGQALLETSYYEPQSGQLLTASFMDYAMPRADTLPFLAAALSEAPAPANRLGVRSGGEGGTTPALAAVINATVDALAELGVRHIEIAGDARPGMARHPGRMLRCRGLIVEGNYRPRVDRRECRKERGGLSCVVISRRCITSNHLRQRTKSGRLPCNLSAN
jgi:hypothetical protein